MTVKVKTNKTDAAVKERGENMAVEKAIYNAKDIQKLLDINLVKTYELFQMDGFPAIRIGRRIVVPKKAFWTWLEEAAGRWGKEA